MNRSFSAYGSSSAQAMVVAKASVADRLFTLVIVAGVGALAMAWVHFSPFASFAMSR